MLKSNSKIQFLVAFILSALLGSAVTYNKIISKRYFSGVTTKNLTVLSADTSRGLLYVTNPFPLLTYEDFATYFVESDDTTIQSNMANIKWSIPGTNIKGTGNEIKISGSCFKNKNLTICIQYEDDKNILQLVDKICTYPVLGDFIEADYETI